MIGKKINKVSFGYYDVSFYFPNRKRLKEAVLKIFKLEGVRVDGVSYIFCSDNYLLEFNKTYLKHNTFTDIITFQYSQPTEPVLSEIFISIDRVKDNAKIYKCLFLKELYRVIFHGALHLCGYKDKTPLESSIMKSKEEYYLTHFVPRETK